MRIVWTIALRSRLNHKNSLRYRGSLPKRVPLILGDEGRESAWAKLPLSPRFAPHTLKRIAPVIVTRATIPQVRTPERNENDPSDCLPRNSPNHGHGTTVKS